jgi:hypothetical protein
LAMGIVSFSKKLAPRHQLRIPPTDLLVRSPPPRPKSLPPLHTAVPIGARVHHPIGSSSPPLPPGAPSSSKWAPRHHASMANPRRNIPSLSLARRSTVPNPNPYKPDPLAMTPRLHLLLSRPVRTRLRALFHGSPSPAPDPHRRRTPSTFGSTLGTANGPDSPVLF